MLNLPWIILTWVHVVNIFQNYGKLIEICQLSIVSSDVMLSIVTPAIILKCCMLQKQHFFVNQVIFIIMNSHHIVNSSHFKSFAAHKELLFYSSAFLTALIISNKPGYFIHKRDCPKDPRKRLWWVLCYKLLMALLKSL